MVMDREYTLRIDAFTLGSMPAGRFSEYVKQLAQLLGEAENVHFKDLTEGSARLAVCVDEPARYRVRERVNAVLIGEGTPEAVTAQSELDKMLANDNAVAELIGESGAVILQFQGRTRPKPIIHGPFVQEASVQGQLVRIGGQDRTAHAILQDGDVTVRNITLKRELAADLAKFLYRPIICLLGKGKYYRLENGDWVLDGFTATSFEQLDDTALSGVIDSLRAVGGSGWSKVADPLKELRALR